MAMVTKQGSKSVQDAAKLLNVSPDTIRRWHKKGLIKATLGQRGERLFSLKEINRLIDKSNPKDKTWKVLKAHKSNLNCIELFCGAGGLALGLHNAGINSELLVDFDKDSINTIKKNQPNWNAVCKDVTKLNLNEYQNKIDIMSGGFPCQAFSYAGKGLGFADTRGTLFYEYIRLIEQVNPKLVIGENVKGLLNHDSGRTLNVIIRELENKGYFVTYKILKAQFLDVPQKRERLIILGLRNDIKNKIYFPKEKDYTISVRAALKDVPSSNGQNYTEDKKKIMALVPEGGYWKDLPSKIQKKYMGGSFFLGGGKTGMARRLSWDEPSLTLTCNPAQKQTERCHPSETRPLTIREYARIQTFPDSWEFTGSTSSQYRQIGNAVPVNLGYHVGLTARTILNDDISKAERISYFIEPGYSNQTLF